MKPVVIFRHSPTEGPAYFATFLEAHGIPWRLIAIDRGESLPAGLDRCSGVAFMGGPMSVNDPLPWIPEACELIRGAVAADLPVIGHCLGGQLMSLALGGRITRNRVKEIGWSTVEPVTGTAATDWLGDLAGAAELTVFQWHGETFSLPAGTHPLLRNAYCENQAFVLGPHLAMQCHVEMTSELIEKWCENWGDEVTVATERAPCIETPPAMIAGIERKLPAMRVLADRLYANWIKGLARG